MRRSLLVVALLTLALSAGAQAPPLVGTLVVVGPQPTRDPSTLSLSATVRNDAHQSWLVPVVPLSIAQLSVDVRDAHGRRVPTVPPPVPRPGDDRREPLASGQSRTFVLSLGVFSPPLPPGTYTADWGEREGIAAAPVTFVVAP
jgi:hypothetical protein